MLKKYRKFIFSITLLLVMAYAGYFFYYQKNILPYQYWYQLMKKDPKPSNVSFEEYQRKNRQGFCWRDKKYYTPDELKQKAMLSLVEDVLLPTLNFHKTGEVLNANDEPFGGHYAVDCIREKLNCRLWLIPKEYTTNELMDLYKLNPKFHQTLFEGNKVLIYSKDDVVHVPFNDGVNKNMLMSVVPGGVDFYPPDCCTIKSHQEMMADGEEWWLATGRGFDNPYDGYLPNNLNIRDYGVGNYFLEVAGITYAFSFSAEKFYRTYFLNNCGDVLFKPYYWRY